MGLASEQLLEHFDQRGIRYQAAKSGDTQILFAGFQGELWNHEIRAITDDEMLRIISTAPLRIPEGARSAIGEVCARINYVLRLGHYDLGYDDGRLHFCVSHLLGPEGITDETIAEFMRLTLQILDAYTPAFLGVLVANETPAEAVRLAEIQKGIRRPGDDDADDADGD